MRSGQPAGLVEAAPHLRRPATVALGSVARRRIVVWVPPVLVGLLALPFILHQNAWWEWQSAYWLLERQTEHVAAHGTPTFFLHTVAGTFDPQHLFYAGFVLSLLAYPAAVVGAWPIFAASIVAALVAGYLGIWWTARNLGLSRELAVLPALTFATTPYLLTDLYGRGAWAELLAVNAAAVLLGGITALLWHPERARRAALTALVGAGATIAGTHNLTLMMSALVLPLILLAILPTAPRPNGVAGLVRPAGRAVGAIALGIGLTGAWLVPNLWFGPQTAIADPAISQGLLHQNASLLHITGLLTPWPSVPADVRGTLWLYVQPPVLAMAWALVALAVVTWMRRRDRAVLSAAALLTLGTALLVLIADPLWWPSFPRLIQTIQVPVRLMPYLAMVIALGLMLGLTSLPRGRARWILTRALVLAVAAQVGMGIYIALDTEAGPVGALPAAGPGDVAVGEEPASFSSPGFIVPVQFRVMGKPTGPMPHGPVVNAGLDDPSTSDTATLTAKGTIGQQRSVAVNWSPFIRIGGDAHMSGRDKNGLAVVRITHTDKTGRWTATASSRCNVCLGALTGRDPWQLLAGRLLTLLSALAVAGFAVTWLRRRRRQTR